MRVDTVQIKHGNGFLTINATDYRLGVYELYRPGESKAEKQGETKPEKRGKRVENSKSSIVGNDNNLQGEIIPGLETVDGERAD